MRRKYNHNHDPDDGQFATGDGDGDGGSDDLPKPRGARDIGTSAGRERLLDDFERAIDGGDDGLQAQYLAQIARDEFPDSERAQRLLERWRRMRGKGKSAPLGELTGKSIPPGAYKLYR